MGKKHGNKNKLPRYKKPKIHSQVARTDSGIVPDRRGAKSREWSRRASSARYHKKRNRDFDFDDASSGDADDEDDNDSYEEPPPPPPPPPPREPKPKKEKPPPEKVKPPKPKPKPAKVQRSDDSDDDSDPPQEKYVPVAKESISQPQPKKGKLGKLPGQGKLDLKELTDATKLWLDYSRNNFGMFSKTAYEYNIFAAKHQRLLTAVPGGGTSENIRDSEKPKSFAINTPHGAEVCKLHFTTGNCFKRVMSIDVSIDREVIGGVRQEKNKFLVTEQRGNLLFEVRGIPTLGVCNQMGPDRFNSDIYFPGESQIAGAIGRNGSLMSDVIVGEPSGFYFLARKSDSIEFDVLHKVLILSILITLMTQYAD
ncbi:unnamed protein product [Allacma fusca]|uniref:Uncharacterized protein n=1 Tax=Allacma fusca TaxID=39272 RepID=A0A8J2IYF7_9HEXA|nr:unnamed protein product [Allacma fusca]